jgi:hypothetical protein
MRNITEPQPRPDPHAAVGPTGCSILPGRRWDADPRPARFKI